MDVALILLDMGVVGEEEESISLVERKKIDVLDLCNELG